MEDRTGLSAGTYTVTITDANNCTTSTSVIITQPTALSVTSVITNSTNCTTPNGAINITASGGTPAYTYDWGDIAGTNNVEDRTGLSPGVYNVTVTDANGCTRTNTFTVGAPPNPSFSPNAVTNVLCFGQSTGAINVTLTGGVSPYTYDWADLAGTNNGEDRINIPAGTYTVTATDNVGCTASTSATVTQPAAALAVTLTGVSTTDCVNGTIDITVSGGTGVYTYDWSNDGPETPDNDPQDLVINALGTYTVTVTDANGCTSTLSASYIGCDKGDLPDPSYPTLNASNGPSHVIVPGIKIGATIDAEVNGQPNGTATGDDGDEDGFIPANVLFASGQTVNVTIPVMNMNAAAKMTIYIDWNKDGDLVDANEMFSAVVALNATSVTIPIAVPVDAVINMDLGMRIRLTTSATMSPTGFAPDGEVEDYFIQVIGYDYGDLPETYNTSGNDNPPNHIVSNNLKLGASVDAELDGAPEAMAGLMTGGDDNTAGLATFGISTPAGDDENGVTFLTPMIPGSTACISVTAMNMNATPAVLQMWIDFNGDGDMLDAGEAVTTGSFNGAGGGAVVPATVGLTNAQLCFNVPAGATFASGGAAFVRFRLSPVGGLAPNTQTAPVPLGEIEDYKVQLMCVGNMVWEDYDFDGQQDPTEPGIGGVTINLVWGGADGNTT
ncbi:MAG: GEVED domain-containing protein, partial [Bacteroidota bacterium]